MSRGRLRVYLGAAPGVGKTVAMLSEGRRRRDRGTDVAIALVEDHGRAYTAEQIHDLPVVPRRTVTHRGIPLTEMDVDAVLAMRPQVALVDELAHTNAPDSRNPKRWQDVAELLDAGIDVITTVNVQHLESLNDVVAGITGVAQAETVPDEVVRSADQIELVDMTPQALRRRMAHGHIYPAERVDTALSNYFREGNLTALRELALLWVADRVDEGLARYRAEHGITGTWAARERIVVALTGGGEGPMLLRRGARIAGRVAGRDLVAVHVVRADGSVGATTAQLEQQRILAESLGGTFQIVVGDDIARTVLDFTRSVNGTQIIVGASRHSRLTNLLRTGTSMAIVRDSGDIDVHVVTHRRTAGRRRWRWPRVRGRRAAAWVGSVAVPLALAALLLPWRHSLNLTTELLIFMIGVLATALIGGVLAAAISAVVASIAANLLFTPPIGSLTIAEPENVFALVVFVIVGVTVASIVDRSRARARQAARGRAEAQLLASLANRALDAPDPVQAVLHHARTSFTMTSAAFFSVSAGPAGPQLLAVSGTPLEPAQAADPHRADALLPAGRNNLLALYGRPLAVADRRLAEVFAAQAVLAADRARLSAQTAEAARLRQADAVRTAVLAALSHDLRTPLATIKASVSSLRDRTVAWSDADRTELLAATAEATDALDALLANLLDLSRLQTGALVPVRRPVAVAEVLHRALVGLPAGRVADETADDLPLIDTDLGLLERVLANIVSNAVRHSPPTAPIRILAGVVPGGKDLQIRVVDRGPGVGQADRERIFAPFQRLGDVPSGSGVGLGLAVARGLAEAVDATVDAEDTAGGGLTMIVTVPLADKAR